jgi:hypothetical protein
MKAVIEICIEAEGVTHVQEIACLERDGLRLAEIGLTLAESKSLLAAVQKIVVDTRLRNTWEASASARIAAEPTPRKGATRSACRLCSAI